MKNILTLIILLSTSSLIHADNLLVPQYIAADYESDTMYQACEVPLANGDFRCHALHKDDISFKSDGYRVVARETQITFTPVANKAPMSKITWTGLVTFDCSIHNISYMEDGQTVWTDWEYKKEGLVSRMLMDKACSLRK